MQLTETHREGLKREYKITIPADVLNEKVDTKLAEAQPEIQMKGFRKGKVSLALLKKQFGDKLMAEAMQDSIKEVMEGHFEKSGERPANQPSVEMDNGEAWKAGGDLEMSFRYEAMPDIPDYDFSKITLERLSVKPGARDIEESLNKLAETTQTFKTRAKTAKAKSGDQVVMDFVGKVDGEAFDGGKGEGFPLVLGSGSFIPGFEEQLEGIKAGANKVVKVTFPKEYGAAHLAGKDAVFECVIKSVKGPEKAEINDELAKQFGNDDLVGLKAQISERLSGEYEGAAKTVLKRHLMDELDKAFSFDLPPSMVENEANQIAHKLWHDENLDVKGHDHPEITPSKEHIKLAERRVRLGLLLAELGSKNKIEVSDGEMSQAIREQAQQYPGQEQKFFEAIKSNENIRQQIQAPIFEDKVVAHILALASVSEKAVKKPELEKALEALEEE